MERHCLNRCFCAIDRRYFPLIAHYCCCSSSKKDYSLYSNRCWQQCKLCHTAINTKYGWMNSELLRKQSFAERRNQQNTKKMESDENIQIDYVESLSKTWRKCLIMRYWEWKKNVKYHKKKELKFRSTKIRYFVVI